MRPRTGYSATHGSVRRARFLRALKERPDQWAVIGVFAKRGAAHAAVARLRSRLKPVPGGRFEFTTRSLPGGGAEVYALFFADDADPTATAESSEAEADGQSAGTQ